jgi:hypothetical protein
MPCALAALVLKVLANEPCPASCSDLPPTSPCAAHKARVTWRLHVESADNLPRCATLHIPPPTHPTSRSASAIRAYSSRRTTTPGQQGGSADLLGLNALRCCAHARKCVRHARTPERALGAQPQRAVCAGHNRGCATAPTTRNAPYGYLNWTGHEMPLASCPRAASTPSTRPPQGGAWPPLTSSPPQI